MTEHEDKMILIRQRGTHSVSHQQSHRSTSRLSSTLLSPGRSQRINTRQRRFEEMRRDEAKCSPWRVHICVYTYAVYRYIHTRVRVCSLLDALLKQHGQIICVWKKKKKIYILQPEQHHYAVTLTLSLQPRVALTYQLLFWCMTCK